MTDFKTISLALQGGGTYGAFGWGVLDRLLQCNDFLLDGLSGSSAGWVSNPALFLRCISGAFSPLSLGKNFLQ